MYITAQGEQAVRFCVMDQAKNGKPKQRASCAADKIVILVRLRPLL